METIKPETTSANLAEVKETAEPQQQPSKKRDIIKDIWDAILNDSWMYVCTWGKPRVGKTTCNMKLAYQVYKDWDLVLECFCFHIGTLLYKMKKGEPQRISTRNLLHSRIPFLILDDFGANSNKAKIQHEPAWDIFKGAFDTFATRIAVLCANMNTPDEITLQLQQKYTAELFIPYKGIAKYDVVDWSQNYAGWVPVQDKIWLQTIEFEPAPSDVYKEYDDQRSSLVDELLVQIDDKMVETQLDATLKRLQPDDKEFLQVVRERGELSRTWLDRPGQHLRDAVVRCKARNLIVIRRRPGLSNYYYDLTDLGLEVVSALAREQQEKEDARNHNDNDVKGKT